MPLVLPLGTAYVAFTDREDGDFAGAGAAEQRAVVDLPWHTVHQVHGRRVVTVSGESPGHEDQEVEADGLVTAAAGIALAVRTADCTPVALASRDGVIGVAHVGWRGAAEGLLEAAVAAMGALGATAVQAALGPCIRPGCYEFSGADLDQVASRLGDGVRSTTASGAPALELPAAVRTELDRLGVEVSSEVDGCTACDRRWFSHRARGERGRMATVVWRP